jgi:D-alanine-D-alanine ligase
MKLLIITPPYDPERGVGIPPEHYAWLADLLIQADLDTTLIQSDSVGSLRAALLERKPDLVFSAAYSDQTSTESPVVIHRLLVELGIPFIGSPPETLELSLDKGKFKRLMRIHAIRTPEYWTCLNGKYFYGDGRRTKSPDKFPFILKPLREGNSRGISESSIVRNQAEMDARLEQLLPRYRDILIEKYLGANDDLREFTVAMIGNGDRRLILPAEILLLTKRKRRVITTFDKNQHGTKAVAVKDEDLRGRLVRLADSVFTLIHARDYSRCDILMTGGEFNVIEVNGQPMIPDTWFDACAGSAGLDRRQYCLAIFQAGMDRYDRLPGIP